MLRSMREGAKSPVMKVFLLFLAAGFALWGIGDMSGGFLSSGNKAVQAGDQSVSAAGRNGVSAHAFRLAVACLQERLCRQDC